MHDAPYSSYSPTNGIAGSITNLSAGLLEYALPYINKQEGIRYEVDESERNGKWGQACDSCDSARLITRFIPMQSSLQVGLMYLHTNTGALMQNSCSKVDGREKAATAARVKMEEMGSGLRFLRFCSTDNQVYSNAIFLTGWINVFAYKYRRAYAKFLQQGGWTREGGDSSVCGPWPDARPLKSKAVCIM